MELHVNGSNFYIDMSDTPNPDAHLRMMRAMSYVMVGEPMRLDNDGIIRIEGKLAPGVDYVSALLMYEHGQQPVVPLAERLDRETTQ